MDHLPECFWPDAPERAVCICDRLRACEQRVRHEGLGVCIVHYDAGVSAAYEAVLNAGLCAPHRCQSDALAAIDALRGEE